MIADSLCLMTKLTRIVLVALSRSVGAQAAPAKISRLTSTAPRAASALFCCA
jgi:hypothetical protein